MNTASSVCASSGKTTAWDQIDWPQCERQVRRLQARIVKATRGSPVNTGSAHTGLGNGLSRMKGNFHVRFLGEGAAAMPFPYPTSAAGIGGIRIRVNTRSAFSLLLLGATVALAERPKAIERVTLDDRAVTSVPVATNPVTTISFPGPITAIDGFGFTLVFHVVLRNKSERAIRYLPGSFRVRVGNRPR